MTAPSTRAPRPALPDPFGPRPSGSWSTAASAAGLADLLATTVETLRLLAEAIPAVAETEAKVALALHLHELAEAAVALERRRRELGSGSAPGPIGDEQARALAEVRDARTSASFLDRLAAGWLVGLEAGCGSFLAAHHPVTDRSSGRVVRRLAAAVADLQQWLAAAAAAAADGAGGSPCDLADHRARRDDRYRTFDHTGDYRATAAFPHHLAPYEARRLELAWINRDEIDAIETFAHAVRLLLGDAPLEVIAGLARIAADEACHATAGHELLASFGVDPHELPCSLIGIRVRERLAPWDAVGQISRLGERAIVVAMRRLVAEARAVGDRPVADAFGFICRDEAQHIARVQGWLRTQAGHRDLDALEADLRRQTAAHLVALAIYDDEETYLRLDRRELLERFGE